jgi:hypothetical protein
VKSEWATFSSTWNTSIKTPGFAELRRELDGRKAHYDHLPEQRARRLQKLVEGLRQKQMEEHLDKFPIQSARIPGVGPAKVAMLSSHGIDTAGDINQSKVLQVPGFGPATTRKLLAWRRLHEQTFRFDPRRGVSQSDMAAVERDITMARSTLEREIAAGLGRLKAMVEAANARRRALEVRATELTSQYIQAAADAQVIVADPTMHKRLLGLATATFALAIIMLASGRSPQAEPPPAFAQAPTQYAPPAVTPPAPKAAVSVPKPAPALPPATFAPALQEPAPAATIGSGKVIARQAANVRDVPNGTSVLRTVPLGAVLRVYARRDGWVQIGEDNPWGWVYSGLLTDAP